MPMVNKSKTLIATLGLYGKHRAPPFSIEAI
jgi:hypothetical protein